MTAPKLTEYRRYMGFSQDTISRFRSSRPITANSVGKGLNRVDWNMEEPMTEKLRCLLRKMKDGDCGCNVVAGESSSLQHVVIAIIVYGRPIASVDFGLLQSGVDVFVWHVWVPQFRRVHSCPFQRRRFQQAAI